MLEKVRRVIDDQIRPALSLEGGEIELVDVKDGTVLVRLVGACAGCPASRYTLKNFVEATIRQEVPEVKEVVAL